MRRPLAVLGLLALLASLVAVGSGGPVVASPVAFDDATYLAYGRVFPDPHGCSSGAPGQSPWAKGNVCAAQFVQWDEALDGIRYLEGRFPDYVELLDLATQYDEILGLDDDQLRSAGLPREDLSRDKRDLHVIKVTDRTSSVPEVDRKHFAYSLSIHGIERAGLEGGIRAVEDLVTWAACEDADPDNDVAACTSEGPFPKPILEPSGSGPTASAVLDGAVIYFVLANPDGWRRGEYSQGGVFFQRYNGNGMDLNRDWPTIGYTEAQYTPFSEPESRGYGAFLSFVRDRTTAGRFEGAIDLHGMIDAEAFSYTLLGAGQRDYRKNAVTVDTSIRTFRDSEARLAWSPLIAPASECPNEVAFGVFAPICSDQWGTVWDTIDYQVTGSFGDWMDSPIGLDAVGIDNEMYVSHLAPNNVFDPDLEQLHIDGNKGLIYAQIASLLEEPEVQYVPGGRIAYISDPDRTTDPGGQPADDPTADLPAQDDIVGHEVAGVAPFEFVVEGPSDGVRNGGLTVEATFTNARGVSGGSLGSLVLERFGGDHPGDPEEWQEVAHYFNQSAIYLQGGARIDLNDPKPGRYRIRPNAARSGITEFHVSFSSARAYPVPEQAPYDVSRVDFFTMLNEFAPAGSELTAVSVDEVLADPSVLSTFDSVVAADELMPGFVAPSAAPEPEPTGPPQDPIPFSFGPESAPVAQVTSDTFEFDVVEGADNDVMTVSGSWPQPSDYDLHVEFQNADGEWESRGCQCAFVNDGETVTLDDPVPGRWRVRLENFLAAPQPVEGTIEFASVAEEVAPESRYTVEEFRAYADALSSFARGGGNLVLTDGAIAALPDLGTGIAREDVFGGFFYAGWMDFNDGDGPTYPTDADGEPVEGGHPLASGVNKEGTAEGSDTVDGRSFENRHQTYEPVPLGYYVSESASANSECDSDRCDSPNWIVVESTSEDGVTRDAWRDAGGTTAARTLARETTNPGSPSRVGTSLGELPLGEGVVRIAGGLLPEPTEENFHPFGLSSYALTYTGYQLFENLTTYTNPNRQDGGTAPEPAPAVALDCGDCAVEVRAGESATQPLTVTNTGNVGDRYVLEVSAPDGWDAAVEPASVSLAAAESAEATLTVTAPRNAKAGEHPVEVSVRSPDTGVSDGATVVATVRKGAPSERGGGREGGGALLAGAASPAGAAAGGMGAAALVGLVAATRRRRTR